MSEEHRRTNAERQRAYRERKSRAVRNAYALQIDKQLFKPIERPPIRYYGGKWRLGKWIIGHFPPHTCFVEPFAGGSSVLLQKAPVRHEVLNDLNHDVINFFDMLRSDTEALIRAIWLTPYSRQELRRALARRAEVDALEKARRFYVRCWQSFGSGVGSQSTGWRFAKGGNNSDRSPVPVWNSIDHLWAVAERLKVVQIECDDAFAVIARFDGPQTLFYVDPPYVHSTRYHNSPDKGYSHEMTDGDHRQLAHLVKSLRGMVVVSGYPSPLYDELFSDWQCVSKEVQDVTGSGKQTECLWLSPSATAINCLPLFTGIKVQP